MSVSEEENALLQFCRVLTSMMAYAALGYLSSVESKRSLAVAPRTHGSPPGYGCQRGQQPDASARCAWPKQKMVKAKPGVAVFRSSLMDFSCSKR